jgi:TolB protein
VPSALAGRFDALNVFDGSRGGTYEERYYRYLDIGLRLPISTGTDWFLYDFSRVYARVEGETTIKNWLQALKSGRNVATNGPLLRLTVDGKPIGEVLKLDKEKTVRVEAEGVGRHAFERLQLVHNGKVVQEARSAKKDGGYSARLVRDVKITEQGWFAVRIESKARNELDQVLFAHSSPCYVEYEGRRRFDLESAQTLQKRLEEAKGEIAARGEFSNARAKENLLAVYADAITDLRARINKRGKQ